MKKCSRQGRAHNTESGELVCVCPRRFESPLGVGGDERERECGNCALFPAPGGLRDLVSSSLGSGFEVGHFVLLGTVVSQNYFSAPNWMVHKVAQSPRAKPKMQVKSDLKSIHLGHHVTDFIDMSS